jgi:hypothetical protein
MLCGTMPALAYIPNLNAPTTATATTHDPRRKPHRIPHSLPRQPPTSLRITKVAELPQFLLRWNLTLMSRRCALPAPSTSQRKPPGMPPGPIL